MRSISSRQNPIVRTFRELAADPPADGSRLLLDGVHLVREARAAGLAIEHAAVVAEHIQDGSEIADVAQALERDEVPVHVVTRPVMDALSPLRSPAGLVAIAARTQVSPAEMCRRSDAFIVAAVDVQDPGNVGSLVRAAEAGGATGLVVAGASASPFSWKAVRGSMGSVFRLPVAAGVKPEALLKCAQKFALRSVASVARGGTRPEEVSWTGKLLLFVGGEGLGLADELVAQCDARVTIPMQAPVESLNVAVAGALLVYEARRHR